MAGQQLQSGTVREAEVSSTQSASHVGQLAGRVLRAAKPFTAEALLAMACRLSTVQVVFDEQQMHGR
jgi:hypothetical protein